MIVFQISNPRPGQYKCIAETFSSDTLGIAPFIQCEQPPRTPDPPSIRCLDPMQRPFVPNYINPTTALYRTVILDAATNTNFISNEEIVSLISTIANTTSTTATTRQAVRATTQSYGNMLETTSSSNGGSETPIGLVVGAALGVAFGLVVTILLILVILCYWRNPRRKNKQIQASNFEPLLTQQPPTTAPPRNDSPILNGGTATENIEMATLQPSDYVAPLPYEQVANHYTDNPDENGTRRNYPKLPPIPNSTDPIDVSNVYSRPKFYKPKKNRGFSTSTHTYGDLDFASSASSSSSYISPDHVSKAWVKAKTLREIEKRELQLDQEGMNNEDLYEVILEEDDVDDDQYLDIIDSDISTEKVANENDSEEGQDLEDNSLYGDIEDSDTEEIYDSSTDSVLKPKNPETGQSKLLQPKSVTSDLSDRYINAVVVEHVEDVQYINTRRAQNGEITPYVPTRRRKKIPQSSTKSIPGKPPPPRNKRKVKRNHSTPTKGYASIDHHALDMAGFYSKCSFKEDNKNDNSEDV